VSENIVCCFQVKDAVALCLFFNWLEKAAPRENLDELIAADYAENFRK
jgi:IS5 family transposase